MRVRIKTWLPTLVGLAAFGAVGGAVAGGAGGDGCGNGCQPPPPACCKPPAPPPPPPRPPGPCCDKPTPPDYPGGGGGRGNINVNVNVNANANANANANGGINARGSGDIYINGGGGAYFSVEQPYPTVISGLQVEAMAEAEAQVIQVPVTASRWSAFRVVIQAVCIDDRNIPHPASQVQPGREVFDSYEGELFRCIAGTRMQIAMVDLAAGFDFEHVSFDHGQTMSCRKGESLWYGRGGAAGGYAQAYAEAYAGVYAQANGAAVGYGPGGQMGGYEQGDGHGGGQAGMGQGGVIECRPQKPERDCNERSLLRRYGAGLKVLTLWREETYTEYHEQVVQAAAAASAVAITGTLTLDGGVGGRVF